MRIPRVFDVAGSATHCRALRDGSFIEDSRVVTGLACRTWIIPVDVVACVPGLVTTTARQHPVNAVTLVDAVDAGNDTDAVEVYAMKLSVSPLSSLVRSNAVLL